MPPRQPLKLTKAPRKPSAKKQQVAPLTDAIAPPLPPQSTSKPSRFASFSPYPDLTMAIAMLEKRRTATTPDLTELIDKWLISLKKVQSEMTRLRKLEELTEAVKAKSN